MVSWKGTDLVTCQVPGHLNVRVEVMHTALNICGLTRFPKLVKTVVSVKTEELKYDSSTRE